MKFSRDAYKKQHTKKWVIQFTYWCEKVESAHVVTTGHATKILDFIEITYVPFDSKDFKNLTHGMNLKIS